MTWAAVLVETAYFSVLSVLALYGLHRLSLVHAWLRHRRSGGSPLFPPAGGALGGMPTLPTVTVQLPIYNEYYVVQRLVHAACALTYPRAKLEIQVLDDSTDGTSALAAELVASYRARGVDIHHIRRTDRRGYKAGALAEGMSRARGTLFAIFDADFIPPSGFLMETVPRFAADSALGMVQARWGHVNRDYSLLTRAQALLLDGHFVVEHGARSATGRFLNFNGTAGILRRDCIEQAGGWQDDTLTEDLDLSYRAQLAGWKFEYLGGLLVPAELPVEFNSLRSQQRRWAKGSVQTAMKLAGRVVRAPLPRVVKMEALVHLTNNVCYLLLAMLAMLIVPALAVRPEGDSRFLPADVLLFLAGSGSFALFCAVAQRETRKDWRRALLQLPAMMALGIGLCLNNALAVIEALRGQVSEFHRTPKHRIATQAGAATGSWRTSSYQAQSSWLVVVEAAFAVWFAAAIVMAVRQGRFASLPFLGLFESGFLYVTILTVAQDLSRRFTLWTARPAEAPAP